jgi:hypothetical protein
VENKRREKMKKSLLLWGALIVVALCFVGCCYYNTTHNTHPSCAKHCHHKPCCNENGKQCPDAQNNNADNDVETVTIEAMEIVPVTPADGSNQTPENQAPVNQTPVNNAPAAKTPAAGK